MPRRDARLPGTRQLPAAFTGDVGALCVASWHCLNVAEPTGSPDACGGSAASAAAAGAAAEGTLLLAGGGSQLLVYELPAGRLISCTTVLPDAARLHGIAWLPCPAAGGRRPALLVAVHGGRHAALLHLLGPAPTGSSSSDSSGTWKVQPLAQLRFLHWTMDAQLAGGSGGSMQLAVGLSNNSVELFAVQAPCSSGSGTPASGSGSGAGGPQQRCSVQRVGQVECSDRSLLYSMALLPRHAPQAQTEQQEQDSGGGGSGSGGSSGSEGGGATSNGGAISSGGSWLVAAGTILQDVLVWAAPAAEPAARAAGPEGPLAALGGAHCAVVPPLFRLKGHEGSIHRVRWSPCGRLLASGSDDRSLRLWAIPPAAPAAPQPAGAAQAGRLGAPTPELQPHLTLWGHGGRLWDCCFGGGSWSGSGSSSSSGGGGGSLCGPGSFLVTGSEDCTCRVWCLATGCQLAVVEGHRGRGAWSCALLQRSQAGTSVVPAAASHVTGEDDAAVAAAAGCCLFTGGADASLKCWALADWLPQPAAELPAHPSPAAAAAAECLTLQGLPPCPEAAEVGQGRSYDAQSLQQLVQQEQQEQGVQQPEAGSAGSRDSRAEWARCLALTSGSCDSASGSGGGSSSGSLKPWRRRWLYVATNRGLVHRVQLPDAAAGLLERWECIHKASTAAGDARPFLALRLLAEPACGMAPLGSCGGQGDEGSSSSSGGGHRVWLALGDLAGRATVLLDRPSGSSRGDSCSDDGSGSSSSMAGAPCIARWQPYGSAPGPAGVWWGSPQSSSSGGGSGAAGLGSRYCFTTGAKQLLTAWLLPAAGAPAQADPVRLAEVQLPFPGYANAVAAALLPLPPHRQAAAALVAVGDSTGSVTMLLLILPAGLHQRQPSEGAANGSAGAAVVHAIAASSASGSSARLVQLAAARRVHEGTPVRALQLRLPAAGPGAGLQQQLAGTDIVTAGGDGTVRTLRLPPAAVAAALDAVAEGPGSAATPAVEEAAATQHVGASRAAPAAAGVPAAPEAAPLPRLLAASRRRYEAVTHVEGTLPGFECGNSSGGGNGSSSSSSGSGSSGSSGSRSGSGIIYGFHASHFAVWDEGADAEVARVPCGGWRRPAAADVAAADNLAFCVLHNGRLWLYRRRPDPRAPPRCLHPPHHCKEQHCVRLLPLPVPDARGSNGGGVPAAAVACITGGEDAGLRQLVLPLPGDTASSSSSSSASSSSGSGTFTAGGLLAEQVRGTAVKALALLPLPAPHGQPQQWLLLSAGARQALLLSRLRQQHCRQEGSGPLPLICEELAVKDPVASDKQRHPAAKSLKIWSDLRYLTISAFLVPRPQRAQHAVLHPAAGGAAAAARAAANGSVAQGAAIAGEAVEGQPPPLLFILAAASDASLALLCADLAATPRQLGTGRRPQQFAAVAALHHHSCPVLSAAHCCLELPTPQGDGEDGTWPEQQAATVGATAALRSGGSVQRHLVFSGATDGGVAVWDVSNEAATLVAAASALGSAAATTPPGGPEQRAPLELAPLLVLPALHQSGVNAMAVSPAGAGRLLLLTGGDDQGLCITLLQVVASPPTSGTGCDGGGSNGVSCATSCTELLRLTIPNAHSSALRSVWLSPLSRAAGSSGSSSSAVAAAGPVAGAPAAEAAGQAAAAAEEPAPGGPALEGTAFTLGLDQQLRCWRLLLQPHQPAASSLTSNRADCTLAKLPPQLAAVPDAAQVAEPWLDTARYCTSSAPGGSASSAWRIEAQEAGCRFTQVSEPAALDVLPCGPRAAAPGLPGTYLVAVAGRGTELLTWQC